MLYTQCYSAKRKNIEKTMKNMGYKLLCDALCNMYSALLCNSANLGLGGGALGRTRKVAAAVCCGDMSWLLDTALCDLWPTCPNGSLSVSGVSSRHPRSFEFQPAMSAVKGTPCMHIET